MVALLRRNRMPNTWNACLVAALSNSHASSSRHNGGMRRCHHCAPNFPCRGSGRRLATQRGARGAEPARIYMAMHFHAHRAKRQLARSARGRAHSHPSQRAASQPASAQPSRAWHDGAKATAESQTREDEACASSPRIARPYAAAACAFLLRLRFGLAGASSSARAAGEAGWGAGASAAGCSACASSASFAPW
jgi:hypothetical protein